ncbi:hypothetical protein BH11MYX1_BH11MYX1_44560 [soil metagenome]
MYQAATPSVPHDAAPSRSSFAVSTGDVTVHRDLPHAEVARIVHDFQTPLATIALEAELLGYRLAHGTTIDPSVSVRRIVDNAEYLGRMVSDLLDLCMCDSGHLELQTKPRDVGSLIAAVVKRVISSRDTGRIVLELEAPVTALVDEHRLQRVVANLLENALKYAPPAGPIIVRLVPLPTQLEVSVIDADGALPQAELPKVFHEYIRVGNVAAHAGSGLGLYVSRLIVEAHGGTIGVESEAGSGTRFFFTLPR